MTHTLLRPAPKMSSHTLLRRSALTACAALGALLIAASASGAEPSGSDPAPSDAAAPEGLHYGDFLLRPELGLSLLYDSNIFATRNNEIDDFVTLLSPSLEMQSQWTRHRLRLNAGATAARYDSAQSENYDDYWTDLDGRLDVGTDSNLFGGVGFSREHEDRSSPDATLAGDEPTQLSSSRAHAGVARRWGRLSARLGGTFERLDFQDVDPVDNDDRDRDLHGLGLRVNYRLSPRHVVFGQAIYDARRYEQAFDNFGFARDSNGHRLGVGFTGVFSNRLSGGAQVGYLHQDYDDPQFSDLDTVDFSGQLRFRATPRTNLAATLERTLEETTLPGAAGYLYTAAGLQAERRMTTRLSANVGISAAEEDYQDIRRQDRLYSAEFGLRYMLTPRYYLAGSYRLTARDSNQRTAVLNNADVQNIDDYSRQQLFLTLGALLYPVGDTALSAVAGGDWLPVTAWDWHGAFAGGYVAHGSGTFQSSGPRGAHGLDEGEYGESGDGTGLFVGYGHSFDRWYLGIEAEADRASTDVSHRKDKVQSITLDIDRGDSYALNLRGGYHLPGGELVYLRLGRVRTEFDTLLLQNDAPQDAVNKRFDQNGTRLGVGADVSVNSRLFVRMDYSHTAYDAFDAGTESMDPAESYFRLGLGWQLDEADHSLSPAEAIDPSGFYAGASLGHQALTSAADGIHNDSGGTSDFYGDFGHAAGFTGGTFAGWGARWGRWYGGVEATAETSTADWTHRREPTGRNFSVEKQETWGFGLRGGYQLASGALLYVRTDRVRTRFGTRWSKGGNRSADIDRDDRVDGNRIGVGAQLPLTRTLFMRLDYSYTDYDDYGFVTTHGQPDSMRFENGETLFRLGLGTLF